MKPRIKMRQMPGDIRKKYKIELMEKGETTIDYGGGHLHKLTRKNGKSFKKTVRMKEKAVLKERARKEIKEGLC